MLKLLLGQTVKKNVATLKLVDIQLARSLERLQVYLQARKEIEALKLVSGLFCYSAIPFFTPDSRVLC